MNKNLQLLRSRNRQQVFNCVLDKICAPSSASKATGKVRIPIELLNPVSGKFQRRVTKS